MIDLVFQFRYEKLLKEHPRLAYYKTAPVLVCSNVVNARKELQLANMLHWRYDGATYLDPVNDSASTVRTNGHIANIIVSKVLTLVSERRQNGEIGALYREHGNHTSEVANGGDVGSANARTDEPTRDVDAMYADGYMVIPSDDEDRDDGTVNRASNRASKRTVNGERRTGENAKTKRTKKRAKTGSKGRDDEDSIEDNDDRDGDDNPQFKTTHGMNSSSSRTFKNCLTQLMESIGLACRQSALGKKSAIRGR